MDIVKANVKLFIQAVQDVGLREIPGSKSNEEILDMIRKYVPTAEDDSKYGWCGIWLAEHLKRMGLKPPSTPQLARNYTNTPGTKEIVGQKYTIDQLANVQMGDIVVYWRDSIHSWKGHVGLVVNVMLDEDIPQINTLGGNQSNQVNIQKYSAARLLGVYRIL